MKKLFVILGILLISQIGYGQLKVNQLFNEFKSESNVNSINIGKFTMTLANIFTETMGVDGLEVLDFSGCSQEVKDKLTSAIKGLKDKEFETMINSNENGNNTKILVKIEKDRIRELVVATTGNNCSLVRIKGNIKPEEIDRVVNQHNKK